MSTEKIESKHIYIRLQNNPSANPLELVVIVNDGTIAGWDIEMPYGEYNLNWENEENDRAILNDLIGTKWTEIEKSPYISVITLNDYL